jgi:hypothetical protein
LGFSGVLALALYCCFAPLFQKRKPSGLSEKNAIFFLQSFFAFDFAKQMTDVSQARKSGATFSKEKAL